MSTDKDFDINLFPLICTESASETVDGEAEGDLVSTSSFRGDIVIKAVQRCPEMSRDICTLLISR